MKHLEKYIENILRVIMIIISIIGVMIICMHICGEDIWYDEVFSVEFAKRPVGEMIYLTSNDVHPPLYYLYLKTFTQLLAVFGTGMVATGKFLSFLPLVIMLVFIYTYVRKNYGLTFASFLSMLLIIMPQLSSYYVEIRMYSFAMMLIFLFLLVAIKDMQHEDKDITALCLMVILGTLTAYTQYFACVAIAGIYVAMGIYFLVIKKHKKLIEIIVCALISAVLYLPWLPKMLGQMMAVGNSYWIQPMGIRGLFGCIKFLFLPANIGFKGYLSCGLMLLSVFVIFVMFIRKKHESYEWATVAVCFSPIIFVVFIGFMASVLGSPIFVYRYMIPGAAAFYFGIAYMFVKGIDAKSIIAIVLIIPFLYGGHYTYGSFNYEENQKIGAIDDTLKALEDVAQNGDSIIVTNFDQICTLMDYYMPGNEIYLYLQNTDRIVSLMYNTDGQELEGPELKELIDGNKDIYFIGSFNSRDTLLEEWKDKYDIESSLVYDSCLLERYYFNIYKLYK